MRPNPNETEDPYEPTGNVLFSVAVYLAVAIPIALLAFIFIN